jgi:hypothetical protein
MASPSDTVFTQPAGSDVKIGVLPATSLIEIAGNKDRIVAYTCDSALVTIDSFIRFETPYVYDLQYTCSNSVDNAMQDVSENLLVAAATEYRINPPGTGCAVPPTEGKNWIAGAFSKTPDSEVPNVECLATADTTQNECCVVVEGSMQFQPSGGYDGDEFREFVSTYLKESSFTLGQSYKSTYRGATIDYTYSPSEDPRDKLESETEGRDNSIAAVGTAET